jgi:hypothetical protein
MKLKPIMFTAIELAIAIIAAAIIVGSVSTLYVIVHFINKFW